MAKLLLVDDDDRNILALAAILKSLGIVILTARDGRECLDKIEQSPEICLVLLDMMMPVMDGFETLKRLRSDKATQSMPVIALTALAMSGDREQCLEAGANDYCPKPVDLDKLTGQIKRLLNLS